MNKSQEIRERQRKELEALSQNKCWIHGDELTRVMTEPSYGFPSGYDFEVQRRYPYHGLYVDLGCLPLPIEKREEQPTNMCPTCRTEALTYLESIEEEEE